MAESAGDPKGLLGGRERGVDADVWDERWRGLGIGVGAVGVPRGAASSPSPAEQLVLAVEEDNRHTRGGHCITQP